jgi:hypothetical protein
MTREPIGVLIVEDEVLLAAGPPPIGLALSPAYAARWGAELARAD